MEKISSLASPVPSGLADTALSTLPSDGRAHAPHRLLAGAECVLGPDGHAYLLVDQQGATTALRSGGKQFNHYLREQARVLGDPLPKRAELAELDYLVQSIADAGRKRRDVWLRVAQVQGGIEIDLGDESQRRVRITAEGVQDLTCSSTVFERTAYMKPLVRPAPEGDLALLYAFLPEKEVLRNLLLAYITYVIAHPKQDQTKYVILILTGSQGSGKSFTSKLIQRLVDPSVISAQVLPTISKDIAIATRNAHLVVYDNIRSFPPHIADALCVAATGGSITARQLYTDADQQVIHLHGAIVLNGLHHFIDQPDLAQRSMLIHLPQLPDKSRRLEAAMEADLIRALPRIMRGVYDLIAQIFAALPSAQITSPHRMMGFVHWLAAMEIVLHRPALQEIFVRAQADGQREALQENVLSAAVLEFAEKAKSWSGTPTELLGELSKHVSEPTKRSREWPTNAVALSRRLVPLQPALKEQGIALELSRGKERTVRIAREDIY
jgi:hypothetical protein